MATRAMKRTGPHIKPATGKRRERFLVPKMKTHSGAKKRFKLTASGKVKRRRNNMNHINAKMKPERKRRLGKGDYLGKSDEFRAKRLLCVA